MAKLPSVYKRAGSPVYWGSVMINGKRKQYALCENKAAAQRMLAGIKSETKARSKYGDTPFQAFAEKYMAWAKANKSAQTVKRDTLSLEYLQEFHPTKELSEITPALLDEFKSWLKNRTEKTRPKTRKRQPRLRGVLGPHGINRTLQSIKMIMRKAEAWSFVPTQNWRIISKFKTPKGRVEFFSTEEIAQMLEYSRIKSVALPLGKCSPWQTIILLGARAGLRRGEMQNLMWSDIDFKKSILSITPKKDWIPKDYECRDIPLAQDLKEHLQKLPKRGHYILYDVYGERLSVDSITTYFRDKIVKKCGLSGNVHKLRHTFASHLVQNGVDLYTVSKLLGHSSIKTTEIYAHLSPVTLASAVEKLPQINVVKNVVKKIKN